MNKGLSVTLIILLSLIVIALVGGLIYFIDTDFDFSSFSFSGSYTTKLVEEKEISSMKDININTEIADIKFEETESNVIKIELYSKKVKEHEITELDNEIKVVLLEKNSFISFGSNSLIKVYIPKDYSNNIKVKGKTSDIEIGELANANLDATLTTGDINIKKINNVDSSTTTGDIKIDELTTLNATATTGDITVKKVNSLTCTVTTGDVSVDSVDDISAVTTTGDIKVKDIANSLNLKATTGDVNIDSAIINVNSKIETTTGDVNIKKASGCYIDAKAKTGDTRVNNNDRKSDIELVINTKVGDINVNY